MWVRFHLVGQSLSRDQHAQEQHLNSIWPEWKTNFIRISGNTCVYLTISKNMAAVEMGRFNNLTGEKFRTPGVNQRRDTKKEHVKSILQQFPLGGAVAPLVQTGFAAGTCSRLHTEIQSVTDRGRKFSTFFLENANRSHKVHKLQTKRSPWAEWEHNLILYLCSDEMVRNRYHILQQRLTG